MSAITELIRALGRKFLLALKTWQDFAGDTGKAVTTWNYDNNRGWLNNKRYADNTGPAYLYKPSGRLQRRTWARGVQTNYSYNAAGDLTGIDYSDTTPDVTLTHDRAGRPKTTTDAAGTRALSYHASGQLQDEDYTAGLLNSLGVHRTFDSLSRLGSVSALSASSALNQIGYTYDSASRLDTVTSGANTATYSYIANSPLIGGVVFKQAGATRLTTTKVYDNLNRLASLASVPSTSSAVSAAYSYNSANQRTKLTREDNAYWDYGYDALGQVISGKKFDAALAPLAGHDFAWTFDDIGNRKTATVNSQISNYSADLLNQYSSRTVPGVIDVLGAAQTAATVTVTFPASGGTIFPTIRQGELYTKQLTVDNSTAAQYASVKVTGVKNLAGPNGEDAVAEETRNVLVSGTPEVFSHDADGNLIADAKWTYTWDAENRLVAMETSAAAITASVAKRKLEFGYDGQSRRIVKKVYDWNGSVWVLGGSARFLYDGWNMIAELNLDLVTSNLSLQRSYVWGLDLSGSFQGAGGVGGLLFANSHLPTPNSAAYAPAFDGNGNVIGLVDMSSGAKSATYEYGAFGETIVADGPMQDAFPFRFSTRYTDSETSIIMFPLRPYSPTLARFLCKDPIEEDGGANLYGFIQNDGINGIDPLGLVGGALSGGPFTPAQVEGARRRAFDLIVDQGQVPAGLPQNLLRQWLWKKGDYRLSDAEFNEHAWGYKNYRVPNTKGVNTPGTQILSLSMSTDFNSDLASKCSSGGETFTGKYLITDYANTPRTFGHFFWYVEVTVKCGCCKGGYEATGTIHLEDPYDFNPMGRANRQDESDVKTMRWFHNITGMGKDFTIRSSRYPVTETSSCDSGPVGRPFLKRQ